MFCLTSLALSATRKKHFRILPGFAMGGNCHSAWQLADLSPKQFCPLHYTVVKHACMEVVLVLMLKQWFNPLYMQL
jgi:hypothetical protein